MTKRVLAALRVYTIAVAAALNCTSVPAAAAAPVHRPALNRSHALLYVSDVRASQISVFDLSEAGMPRVQRLTLGVHNPKTLAVDRGGNLYVTNYHHVSVFAFGATSPSLILTDGGKGDPASVAVRSDGTVYVGVCCPGRIDVFPPGQTFPSQTITDSLIYAPEQMVFDSAGNLYVADVTTVYEIPAGSYKPVSLGLVLYSYATGIALNERAHRLYVVIYFDNTAAVYAYRIGRSLPLYHFDGPSYFVNAVFGDDHFPYVFVTDPLARRNVLIYPAKGRRPLGTLHAPGSAAVGIAYKASQ